MDVDKILTLCGQHKTMDCPGIVLPVAHVERLCTAYKEFQTFKQGCAKHLADNDTDWIRAQLGIKEHWDK